MIFKKSISTLDPPIDVLKVADLFGETKPIFSNSALDEFLQNTDKINIVAATSNPLVPELGSLLIVGYVSAVESYIRAMIRGVIAIDDVARRLAFSKTVSYGAAISGVSKQFLPDSLLEQTAFASSAQLAQTLIDFINVDIRLTLKQPLLDFQMIVELRHCCAHRFGQFGAKNAVALGLDLHKLHIGKKLEISNIHFEAIAQRIRNFTKSVNNLVYEKLLERTVKSSDDYKLRWTMKWQKDRARFVKYYRVFSTKEDAAPSPSSHEMYLTFVEGHARATRSR